VQKRAQYLAAVQVPDRGELEGANLGDLFVRTISQQRNDALEHFGWDLRLEAAGTTLELCPIGQRADTGGHGIVACCEQALDSRDSRFVRIGGVRAPVREHLADGTEVALERLRE